MANLQPNEYVHLREGPLPEPVEYVPVGEDVHGYTEMIGKQPHHTKKSSVGEPVSNVFVPVHQRQVSNSSRHSSENGRFDMPEYMNAAKEETTVPSITPASDLLLRNGVHGVTSLNPTYGNCPSQPVLGALADDLPPPPPPNVTEDTELPFYSGVNKYVPPQPRPITPVAVVNKKEKRAAESAIYTQQSVPSKTYGSFTSSTSSRSSEDHHQRRQFVRTLFCVLFVLFLMSAAAIGLCVYLLLNWPSESNCSRCSTDATTAPALAAQPSPGPRQFQIPIPDTNSTLSIAAMEGLRALEARLADMEQRLVSTDEYQRDRAAFSDKINKTDAVLTSHYSSLTNFATYQNQTKKTLDALSASVKDVHENFTEVSSNFDRTLQESRVFKNCSRYERRCSGATPTDPSMVARCTLLLEYVPKGYELISVTCESESSNVIPALRRGADIGDGRGVPYSCSCYLPKDLVPNTPLADLRCFFRMFYCQISQVRQTTTASP